MMKSTILPLFALAGCCAAQAASPPPSGDTRIPAPLTVAPFSPPAPRPAPAPPDCRIDAATVHKTTATTTLTLARGEASTAPDLPPPPPPPPKAADPRPLTPEQIARRLYELRHTFNVGATIIDHRVSILHWTDPETRESYEAVCGYDIGLLAGVGEFIRKGERYRFMLVHSEVDTTRAPRWAKWWADRIPQVPEGGIVILRGDAESPTGTAPAVVFGEVIAAEKERLTVYRTARRAHHKAAAEWARAHPEPPRDETVILRPHRGSRYLANPTPEKGAQK